MDVTLISSFGHLVCFTFQASYTLAPKQCGGGCQLAGCVLPLGACAPKELGDGAALLGLAVPAHGMWASECWMWVLVGLTREPSTFGVFCSIHPTIPKRVDPPVCTSVGQGRIPAVGAGSSAHGLGVKGRTASTWSSISSLP